jgi:hypothetical protein
LRINWKLVDKEVEGFGWDMVHEGVKRMMMSLAGDGNLVGECSLLSIGHRGWIALGKLVMV